MQSIFFLLASALFALPEHEEPKVEEFKVEDFTVLNPLETFNPFIVGFPLSCPRPIFAPIPGQRCPILGQQVCLGSSSFITCSSGNVWSVVQRCGPGTVCSTYPGNTCYVLCTLATIPPRIPTPTCARPSVFPIPGASCTTLGQQVCLGTGQFITCASGNRWSVRQNCGTGTRCQGYPGNSCYVLCGY